MILAHPILNQPINWDECNINSFVIENPKMYRDFLNELYEQEQGLRGEFVLSNGLTVLDISKYVEIIFDILKIDTANNKKIITGMIKELTEIAINEKHSEIMALYAKINETISDVIFLSNNDIAFDDINDISQIFKMYNVRPDDENLSVAEKILLHIELCEKLLGKKLFIFLNLHSYFEKEELENLFKDIVYRKHNVFIIERYDYEASKYECKRIIDIDLCEI